jgi:hypothetical protein
MDWRHTGGELKSGQAIFSELKNLCVWNKNNGGMGSFYRSKTRARLRVQGRDRPAHEHVRLRGHGPVPDKRLGRHPRAARSCSTPSRVQASL